jgi:hypothetical protein
MKIGHIAYILTVSASAILFAYSVSWCYAQVWIVASLFSMSLMMWTLKAPLYIPAWDPAYMYGPNRCFACTLLLWAD